MTSKAMTTVGGKSALGRLDHALRLPFGNTQPVFSPYISDSLKPPHLAYKRSNIASALVLKPSRLSVLAIDDSNAKTVSTSAAPSRPPGS